MAILPNLIYRLNTFQEKKSLVVTEKLTLTFVWKGKTLRTANTVTKKYKARELILSDFKTCYKVTVFRTVWFR